MLRTKSIFTVLAASPLTMLVACSGGGGGSGTAAEQTTALTSAIEDVPVAGQFLAECTDAGVALIDGFVGELPLPEAPAGLPTAEDVLAMADPNMIPVIGGLVPGGVVPGDLVPISIEDTLEMIPTEGLPTDLPVIGFGSVSCSDVALPEGELPDPTDALGLVTVFDDAGVPVALVLATVGQVQNGGLPEVTDVGLPVGTDTLPEPLGSTVGSLLGLLDL
jgi:hypothetical protein